MRGTGLRFARRSIGNRRWRRGCRCVRRRGRRRGLGKWSRFGLGGGVRGVFYRGEDGRESLPGMAGCIIASSLVEQMTCRPDKPVLAIAETKSVRESVSKAKMRGIERGDVQVKGETRYIKIQNPGSAFGGWKTPLNVNVSENISVAIFPAVSASGSAEISICANVEAKTKNWISRSKIRPWRDDGGIPPWV
jgi:hypothetical protein